MACQTKFWFSQVGYPCIVKPNKGSVCTGKIICERYNFEVLNVNVASQYQQYFMKCSLYAWPIDLYLDLEVTYM